MSEDKLVLSGFVSGLIATLVMTLIMAAGMSTGVAPMPEPIPLAIAERVIGNASGPALMILGMVSHFLYGGLAGALFTFLFGRESMVLRGLIWGGLLWAIMQLVVLPLLGWGFFGANVTVKIAGATLVLHLVYGAVLGWQPFERITRT